MLSADFSAASDEKTGAVKNDKHPIIRNTRLTKCFIYQPSLRI
ncbi:hypothetical protein THIOSC13_1740003 [uncultured Thiomicrorhabdus sp.]